MSERDRMIDLTAPTERAFLIGLDNPGNGRWPVDRSLEELAALAETAGASVVGSAFQRRSSPDPVWYFGKGRAAELVDEKAATDFNLLIVDDELAPNQQRSLETLLDCKVLDRSALIIDIFARHARTKEGRLQVELAALEYHLPRLTRLWTHLSRTGGGIGTRGPGESQLETDRRLIREKIKKVRADLAEVRRQRSTAARNRDRHEVATVALVGYTNAGKSTLLNALADADVYAADMLFATLDPTSRQVTLPSGRTVVVTDTVGFINKLPHDLVDAFRATLEEVMRADLLLEVVDAADPNFLAQQIAVQSVLDELGAGAKPRITVFNKVDLLPADAGAPPPSDTAAFVSSADRRRPRHAPGADRRRIASPDGRGRRDRALRTRRAGRARTHLGRHRGELRGRRRPRQRAPAGDDRLRAGGRRSGRPPPTLRPALSEVADAGRPLVVEGHLSVEAVLEAGVRTVERVWAVRPGDRRLGRLRALARDRGVLIDAVEADRIEELAAGRTHGGVIGLVGERRERSVDELLAEVGEGSLLVALDGIEDPFNFGQAVRALYAAGVDGLVVRRSWESALSTVTRASAGATELMPTAHAASIDDAADAARKAGLRVVCAVADADATELHDADLTGGAADRHRRRTARRDALIRLTGRSADPHRLWPSAGA